MNMQTKQSLCFLMFFESGLQVLEVELGGTPTVEFLDPESSFGLAFKPDLGGELLELTVEGGQIVDAGGSTWDVSGKAISGPHAG
jgi:hypothetical protein